MNIKLYKQGETVELPHYEPQKLNVHYIEEAEEVNKPKTDGTTATNSKTTFIKACVSMANTWLGCFFIFVPFFASGSEFGFWRAETILFFIIALHWTIFNINFTYKKLRNDLNK